MVPKKTTFIINPNSANGATGKQWPQMRSKTRDRLGSFDELIGQLLEDGGPAAMLAEVRLGRQPESLVDPSGLEGVLGGLEADDQESAQHGELLMRFGQRHSTASPGDSGLRPIYSDPQGAIWPPRVARGRLAGGVPGSAPASRRWHRHVRET